mmetsp:Transcript_38957/g.154165  ORF Transcript_38957/g.154165 Transcript_38957/m.154165 type:complete len:80 (+) Transcript_38957:2340-2579(+)
MRALHTRVENVPASTEVESSRIEASSQRLIENLNISSHFRPSVVGSSSVGLLVVPPFREDLFLLSMSMYCASISSGVST